MNYSRKLVLKIALSCLALVGIAIFVFYYNDTTVVALKQSNAVIAAVAMAIVGMIIHWKRNRNIF